MKTHYAAACFLKFSVLFACLLPGLTSPAQHQVEYLNSNNVNAGFGLGGNLFSNLTGGTPQWQMLQTPKNLQANPIYTAALWMTGVDAGNNAKCSVQRYGQHGLDFSDGPIAATYNAQYDSFYRRVFKATQLQVTHHRSVFASLGTQMTVNDVDNALLIWPAKGNPYVGTNYGVNIDRHLAPFYDVDGDGSYDPVKGDYPLFCGDEAIFFVFNDVRTHAGMGLEVRGLAEVFLDTSFGSFNAVTPAKRAINNTVFVSYEIENRSANPYYQFYLSLYTDFDLGCYANDRIGCDTIRNMMFVYNGNSPDPDCNGALGYGTLDIASAAKYLNQNMSSFSYFTNGANYVLTDPDTCEHYRNFQQGLWNDGSPFTTNGTGWGTGNTPTHFIFPGDPNNPAEWSESQPAVSASLPAGDRRTEGTTGPSTFLAGEIKHFDFAFLTSFDSTATHLTIVDTLKRDGDIIQAYYNNTIQPCRAGQLAGLPNTAGDLALTVYPNPATSTLLVDAQQRIDLVELTDMLGRTAVTTKAGGTVAALNVGSLQRGVYLLKVQAQGKTAVRRVVLQ
jgi:hypothetical protein